MTGIPDPFALFSNPNYQFYATSPVDYFHMRLSNLVMLEQMPERLELKDGDTLKIGVLMLKGKTDQGEEKDAEDKKRRRFITTESQILLHHISETILRLYFAHIPDRKKPPTCSTVARIG